MAPRTSSSSTLAPSSPYVVSSDDESDAPRRHGEKKSNRKDRRRRRSESPSSPRTKDKNSKKRRKPSENHDSDPSEASDGAYKRRKRQSDSDDESDNGKGNWKVQRKVDAKTFCRTVDMWSRISDVLTEGTIRDPDDADSAHDTHSNRYYKSYQGLLELYPTLEEELAGGDLGFKEKLAAMMEMARKAGRQHDTNTLRTNCHALYPFNPSIVSVAKSELGYVNEQTGRLLTPDDLDWDNARDRERLRSGLAEANAESFYVYMYKDYQITPGDLTAGLLRSDLLINMYVSVFIGPHAGKERAAGRSAGVKTTRKGNALIGGISRVTIPSIAYITTLARYALSSDLALSPGGDIGFDYCAFYRHLVSFLNPPDEEDRDLMQEFVDELIAWWNSQIFPRSVKAKTSECSNSSTIAKIRAQQRQKAADGAASAAAMPSAGANTRGLAALDDTTNRAQSPESFGDELD